MLSLFAPAPDAQNIPVWPVARAGFESWLASQPANVTAWAQANQFKGQAVSDSFKCKMDRIDPEVKISASDQEVVGACFG